MCPPVLGGLGAHPKPLLLGGMIVLQDLDVGELDGVATTTSLEDLALKS